MQIPSESDIWHWNDPEVKKKYIEELSKKLRPVHVLKSHMDLNHSYNPDTPPHIIQHKLMYNEHSNIDDKDYLYIVEADVSGFYKGLEQLSITKFEVTLGENGGLELKELSFSDEEKTELFKKINIDEIFSGIRGLRIGTCREDFMKVSVLDNRGYEYKTHAALRDKFRSKYGLFGDLDFAIKDPFQFSKKNPKSKNEKVYRLMKHSEKLNGLGMLEIFYAYIKDSEDDGDNRISLTKVQYSFENDPREELFIKHF